jgi:hypothetical protein
MRISHSQRERCVYLPSRIFIWRWERGFGLWNFHLVERCCCWFLWVDVRKRKEKTTQTKSAWVKEVRVPQNLWEAVGPHYRGGGSAPFWRFSQPTPALWGLFLFRCVLVLDVGCFLLSFCSRIRLCIRILWRWWIAMRWRSLQTLLAVSLRSP